MFFQDEKCGLTSQENFNFFLSFLPTLKNKSKKLSETISWRNTSINVFHQIGATIQNQTK